MSRLLTLLLAILLLGAAIHITVILWIPRLAPASALSLLYDVAPEGRVALLEDVEESERRPPFLDPYLPIGICRINLEQGPHRITADLQSPYWAFSIHRENGAYFYGLTHSAAIEGRLSIELRDPGQTRELTVDPEAAPSDVVQVSLPFTRGYIIIRALAQTPSMRVGVIEALKQTTCGTLPAGAETKPVPAQ
ncbi:hypothetical protein ACKTEK_03175 [Tepidamorphus sp. 3E244]|uniref:DUF1254 domain-containing protein n=1 Tax=Tepidamorphus sp. 3E244 TaxID=3385498 RepID=UPI0038FC57C5